MATIYKTDGTEEEVQPQNGTDFSLKELQGFVGGYIELVSLPGEKKLMVVNEEGKIDRLPLNQKATELFHKCKGTYDVIVGDVLVCDPKQVR